jgi:large subunit ribosomal protein L19e
MRLNIQKRLASDVLNVSKYRIVLDPNRFEDIKEAITKADIKSLIKDGAIKFKQEKGTSKSRARKISIQKSKGRRRGPGSIKGATGARLWRKKKWMDSIRSQRKLLKIIREKKLVDKSAYRSLYLKSKGGFFRSKRHIKVYMQEHGMLK